MSPFLFYVSNNTERAQKICQYANYAIFSVILDNKLTKCLISILVSDFIGEFQSVSAR